MCLLSNKIQREQLNPGDYIYTWRNRYSYSHHGIYVGDGKVNHLTRKPGPILFSSSNELSGSHQSSKDCVGCCSIEEFLSGGDLNLYHHQGVPAPVSLAIHRKMSCIVHLSSWKKASVTITFSIAIVKTLQYIAKQNCKQLISLSLAGVGRLNFCMLYTLTPYLFLPFGFTSLALVLYGLYCGFMFELDRGVEKVPVEKIDSSYHRSISRENSMRENVGIARYLPEGVFAAFAVWVLRYYPVVYRIGYTIRSVVTPKSFDLLRNHPMIQILGGSVAVILWVLDFCCLLGYEGGIYFWSNVGLFGGFLGLDYRGFKLIEYVSHAIMVFGLWYWTQESRILLWKRFVDLNGFLYSFVSDLLRNHRMKSGTRGLCGLYGYWY